MVKHKYAVGERVRLHNWTRYPFFTAQGEQGAIVALNEFGYTILWDKCGSVSGIEDRELRLVERGITEIHE